MAHATNPARFPQGLAESASQHDGGVFDQVVPTHVGVALGAQVDVKEAVPGYLADHVVQEAVSRVHVITSGAVQVNGDGNAGLGGFSLQAGRATRFRRWSGHG